MPILVRVPPSSSRGVRHFSFTPGLFIFVQVPCARCRVSYRRALALSFAILLCCLVFWTRRTAASDGFLPVSPDELKMTSEPLAPGAPAIMLYRQVDRKDLGRSNTEYNYVRIKVLTE